MAVRSTLAVLACTALLASCGGGSDSNSGTSDDYNAFAAWRNLLTRIDAWSVTGTASDGQVYELRLGTAPVANSSFPITGAAANRADLSSSIRQGTTVLGSGVTELYYDNQYRVIGSRIGSSSSPTLTCESATSAAAPPAAAKVGTSGLLYATDGLDGCTAGSNRVGSTTARWSIEAIGGVVYFCIDATSQDLANPPNVVSEKDCIEVATDGSLGTRARISLASAGFSITATR